MNEYQNLLGLAANTHEESPAQSYTVGHSPTSTTQHDGSNTSMSRGVTVYQTTGPEAHTSPILATDGSGAPALNPRSCVTCRRRKVRCDKTMPCSNCRRAHTACVFPAPGRAPRQPRPRDPNAPPKNSSHREMELMKRLRKLEGIVEELSGQIEVESAEKGTSAAASPELSSGTDTQGPPRPGSVAQRQMTGSQGGQGQSSASPKDNESISDQSEAARRKELQQQFGSLVLNDRKGNARYVSNNFWVKLNGELDSLRTETNKLSGLDSEESDFESTLGGSPTAVLQTDHHGFILGYRSADVDLGRLQPPSSHVHFLWSVYKKSVQPLINILHVPTTEPLINAARVSHDALSPSHQALVFAIYYAAIAALNNEVALANLGASCDELLPRYRFAVEQALSKANFLNTSDIAVVQAFAIFLMLVRLQDESRFCWSLTGLVIHIAQGMGLHRDGSHFGLTPFETEIRRRVWWALILLDLRASEELGSDLMITEYTYDTQMPANIDEVDISPETVEFPEPKDGRSDNSVPIIRYEITRVSRRLVRASTAAVTVCPKAGEASFAEQERMIFEVWQSVEARFFSQPGKETNPLYSLASIVSRLIMAKMCIFTYQPVLFGNVQDQALPDDIRLRVLISAIEIMEYRHILSRDPQFNDFVWLFKTYTTWNAIAYTLIEACRRPWTPIIERGWEALNGYEKHPLEQARRSSHAAVFLPLRRLFMRARRHRHAEMARLRSNPDEVRAIENEDRTNSAYTQSGTIHDAEQRMEEVRRKWHKMVQEDMISPISPTLDGRHDSISNTMLSLSRSTPPTLPPQHYDEMIPVQNPAQNPASKQMPADFNISDTAMGIMDDVMTSGTPFSMTAFWPISDVASAELASNNLMLSGTGVAPVPMTATTLAGESMGQQPLAQFTKEEVNGQAFVWPGSYMASTKSNELGGDDTDMLGNDFDWNNWNQTLRGLGQEGLHGLY